MDWPWLTNVGFNFEGQLPREDARLVPHHDHQRIVGQRRFGFGVDPQCALCAHLSRIHLVLEDDLAVGVDLVGHGVAEFGADHDGVDVGVRVGRTEREEEEQ